MPNEPIQGLPYPAATIIPDVPTDIKALADAIAGRLMMRFASKAERDSVLTAPVDGMVCVTLDYGILWRRNGALVKWVVINVPTLASTAIRDTQINDPVVGTRVVVGAGASMAEFVSDGSAWRLAGGVPIESVLDTNLNIVGTSFGSIGTSLRQTLTSPGPSAIWKVELELDYQHGNPSTAQIALAVNGVEPSTGGRMIMFALPTNFRYPARHTWRVSGIAAGTVVFDPQVMANVANTCVIYAGGTHMLVTQVA